MFHQEHPEGQRPDVSRGQAYDASTVLMGIGGRVRAVRRAQKLSLANLSAVTNISVSQLSKIETGKISPTIPSLAAVATALGRPLTFFFQADAEVPRGLATIVSLTDPEGDAVTAFSELVEARTDARMKVQILSSSGLDVQLHAADTLLSGTVDMFIEGLAFYQGHAEAILPSLVPFCFRDTAHYEAFVASSIFREQIVGALQVKGVRFLDQRWRWRRFPQVLASNKPIFEVEDLRGLRIRISDSLILHEFWKYFGARPIFVPWLELGKAIESDIIDCILVSAGLVATGLFGNTLKYCTLVNVADAMGGTVNIGINEGCYQLLPPDIQNVLAVTAKEVSQNIGKMATRSASDLIVGTSANKPFIIRADLRPFHERALTIMRELEGKDLWTPGLLDAIQELEGVGAGRFNGG